MKDIELPEPYGYIFQHEATGLTQCVDAQQVEWSFEKNNPRWERVGAAYLESQVRQIIAGMQTLIDAKDIDRLIELAQKNAKGGYKLSHMIEIQRQRDYIVARLPVAPQEDKE